MQNRPSYLRYVLREAPVLVPAGIIFAVVRGGEVSDWLIAAAGVVLIGFGMGWLIYQRELMKRRPMPPRAARSSSKRRR